MKIALFFRFTTGLMFLLLLCPARLSAQDNAWDGDCFQNPQFSTYTQKIGKYSIHIARLKKKDKKFKDYLCRATIISHDGKVIFEADEPGIRVDPITGKDINGDGHPEVVIEGFTGGAHCCWLYWIISLDERPGLIQKIDNQRDVTFQDINNDGRVEILTNDGKFDYFDCLTHAGTPFPEVIFRLEGRVLKDVGAEFKGRYDKDIMEWRAELTPLELERFRDAKNACETDFEDTMPKVLSIVFGYLYSGREQTAWQALAEMWPAHDQNRIRTEIAKRRAAGVLKAVQR